MTGETGWFPTRLAEAESAAAEEISVREPSPPSGLPGPDLGAVRELKQRTESRGSGPEAFTEQVLTFKVERFHDNGNRRPPIAVEMRGECLWGVVSDGDWVRLAPEWSSAQTVTPEEMWNETTGSPFGLSTRPRHYATAFAACFIMLGFATAVVGILTSTSEGPSPVAVIGFAWFIGSGILFGIVKTIGSAVRPARRPGRRSTVARRLIGLVKLAAAALALGAGIVIAAVAGMAGWFG